VFDGKLTLNCANCGDEFQRFRSQAVSAKHFCSKDCSVTHGLIDVPCSWPGCSATMKGRAHKTVHGRHPVTTFKVDLRRTGQYKQYHFCAEHSEIAGQHLGAGARVSNGRYKFLTDPNCEWDARATSSKFVRLVIFIRSEKKCSKCKADQDWNAPPKTWEVDHIIPVFKGGKSRLDNMQVLCRSCHNEKSGAEKSEVAKARWHAGKERGTRWMTHYEKDQLIASLRAQLEEALRRSK
jgi:5-methylcytosine-specific restriction endonuclease McrA